MKLYQDETIVNEMENCKIADPRTVRPHPELPHLRTAMQFKCLIENTQTELVAHILRQGMNLQGAVTGEAGDMLVQQQMRLTAQKLGHTGAHVPANASESAFPGRVPGLPATEPAATEPAAPGANPPKATTEDEAKLQKALAKIVQRSVD